MRILVIISLIFLVHESSFGQRARDLENWSFELTPTTFDTIVVIPSGDYIFFSNYSSLVLFIDSYLFLDSNSKNEILNLTVSNESRDSIFLQEGILDTHYVIEKYIISEIELGQINILDNSTGKFLTGIERKIFKKKNRRNHYMGGYEYISLEGKKRLFRVTTWIN